MAQSYRLSKSADTGERRSVCQCVEAFFFVVFVAGLLDTRFQMGEPCLVLVLQDCPFSQILSIKTMNAGSAAWLMVW